MRYTQKDIGGDVVKQDDRYVVKDNHYLNTLILSSTELNPGKETTGHRHAGQEEVYFFISGSGRMIVDGDQYNEFGVNAGDVVMIPDGAFHKVINHTEQSLYFVCVFAGQRSH
jgi:oxalate decarboxylase/phosphoglucose isomerase-like protein (cupin superfamily)